MPLPHRIYTASQEYRMALKRSRSVSRPRYAKKSKIQTTPRQRIWPHASKGTGPKFDPFPAKHRAQFRYKQSIIISPTVGTAGPYLFRATSLFDPDFTGTGHQPYGHDQYALIYNRYSVKSATITMTPISQSQGVFGITMTDDSTINIDFDTVAELKTTRMGTMSTGAGYNSVTNYYNRGQVFESGADFQLSAPFGANPAENQYFHCWSEANSSGTTVSDQRFLISITYDVDMWELKDLGQS